MASRRPQRPPTTSPPPAAGAESAAPLEDTAMSVLSQAERAGLAMDAWEPSLLRELLEAENRLPRRKR